MSFPFLTQPIGRGRYEPEGLYLGSPFEGRAQVTQLWGENAFEYRRYKTENVALRGHNGIDFGLDNGAKVLAADRGRVTAIGNDPKGYGIYIRISHRWGQSLYAHLQDYWVESGQRVERGDTIGLSNNTGSSTGPHLHFSIRVYPFRRNDGWGGYTNPLPFLHPSTVLLPRPGY